MYTPSLDCVQIDGNKYAAETAEILICMSRILGG